MQILHLRWWIAGLLFLSTVINYVDRQTLSVLAPVLKAELGVTDAHYANILTAFLAAYTVMYVGSGVLVDRFGTRRALAGFMVWWSAANMAHAFARGPWSLGGLRFLLGLGESGNFMAAFKAVSEWYPARERAFVHGLVQAGATIGAIIAPPVITWINAAYGWQPAFLVTGALGFVWLVFWLLLYHAPERHPLITPEEQAVVLQEESAASAAPKHNVPWRSLLGHPQTWGLLGARFLSDPVWWFYLFWLPTYLVEERGFSMAQMGMLAWLPYLTADLGAVGGGWASGRLVARGWNPIRARLAVMLPAALLMPLSLLIDRSDSWLAITIICAVTFAHMAWKTNQNTLTNDVYSKAVMGTAAGMLAFGTGLGGTLFTWLTGVLVESFGYGAVFLLMGLLHPLSYVVTQRLVRRPLAP
ncbi:MAG: MFS transporter [Planctomycetia bacterium]|jgi:ACS family hexuronate transporter-like MFS transporter